MNDIIHDLQLKIEKLQDENNFKNALISILSHDSKEMSGNFLMLAEAVEQKSISQDDFFKLLPQIKSDAQKNLQAVQDSTNWLKTQYGGFKIKPERIMLKALFDHFKKKYGPILSQKNILLYYKGDPNAFIKTDRILFSFVIDKILNNAVKYSFPGQDVYFQAVSDEKETVISVTDSGTGMDERFVSNIFQHDKAVFQGTAGEIGVGLSLKIVKNFILLMNGNIEIISAEGKGTTVSVKFPVIENE
ncbi:sensor histidine kinase [Chryseobacterium taklimakanense]|uniref:sensor histidine kinase n=1 Tax=Chryseobacterium taklimakanense TaxID=536441 RepID=UPI000F604265|nr:HAMP domain-containing sensor histidine kinase [Chryseobacterium taklimakanense]AZI22322.1 sensor histidine kinase [Chryseobacterium taklimakanense]